MDVAFAEIGPCFYIILASQNYSVSGDNEKNGHGQPLLQSNTIETSGVKVRPAGGARRKRLRKKAKQKKADGFEPASTIERQRPPTEFLQLGRSPSTAPPQDEDSPRSWTVKIRHHKPILKPQMKIMKDVGAIYEEGDEVILEDENGEIIESVSLENDDQSQASELESADMSAPDDVSYHTMGSLRRHMTEYSVVSGKSETDNESLSKKLSRTVSGRKAIIKKGSKGEGKKYFAHQVDNFLFIENADGDIVRRYKLNRHKSEKNRSRSGSIVGKALSMVGFKNKEAKASKETLPENDTVSRIVPDINIMAPDKPPVITEEPNDSGSEDSEGEESDLPVETEVEKKRRLAALGHISNGRNDDDEEA